MKLYLPILVIFISILSCSKEKEPSDDKVKEGITVEKSILLDTSLNNGIDPLEIKENENLGSEVDSLKLLEEQNRKISELMTYLNNPIEENYNYKWNYNSSLRYLYVNNPKVDSILRIVDGKRNEILKNEIEKYLENPTEDNYKERWKYNLFRSKDLSFDSLKLLSFYMGNKELLSKGRYPFVGREPEYEFKEYISSIGEHCYIEIKGKDLCFPEFFNCLISDELKSKYQFNYYDGGRKLYLKIDSVEYKILGYNYDFIDIDLSGQSASDIKTIMNIKIDDNHFLPIVVYEDFGYLSCQFSLTSKIKEDGEIEIHIYNHCGRGESYSHTSEGFLALATSYNVELFYKINEELNVEFKGIRIPEKKEYN